MSNQKSVLTATNLSAGYGGTPVIRDVSLTLTGGGAPIGVIGQSGVGKTTLIHALVGVLKPSGGRVTFNERTVSKLALGAKKNFGVSVRRVQQNGFTGLDSRLTVRKALEADLSKARKAGRDTGASVEDVLETVLLENRYESRTIGTLSGGEKQRLALASALATRPDILILDEPTTALDHTLRLELGRRISEIVAERKIGLLLVSHDLEMIARICSTVHVLSDGTFVESGTPEQLFNNPHHPVTREIAIAMPQASGMPEELRQPR